MLVPKFENNKTQIVETDDITIESINIKEGFYNMDILFSEKAKTNFIKKIEKIIRQSYEYRNYIGLLKNELNITKCTFLPGIDINTVKVGIEFHHYPFTLYNLVAIEVEKDIKQNKKCIDPFDIADRVMIYHYKNLVGLVPLSGTVHELVHAGKKFVNKKYVYGNYEKYIEKNMKYLSEYTEKLDQINELSRREDEGEDIDGNVLDLNFLKVIVSDIEPPKRIKQEVSDIA
jgi:hypothetical protein